MPTYSTFAAPTMAAARATPTLAMQQPPPRDGVHAGRVARRGRRQVLLVVGMAFVLVACGGIGDVIEDQMTAVTPAETVDAGSGGDAPVDEGDPGAFRLASGAWENACTVLTTDQVEAATGFTVLEAREAQGCNWVIESVDPDVVGEPIIGWQPMRARNVDIQFESAGQMGSSIVLEPIEGLGTMAFWQGSGVGDLGEVWAQGNQIGFRVINQFAGPNYTGDARAPLEELAAALVEALDAMDVIAASGDAGQALIPPTSIEIPEGIQTMDGLIDELSAVPMPEGTVFGSGGVYPDRASQDAYSDLSVGDATRFFLEALPAAGFEIDSSSMVQSEEDVMEYAAQSISFTDPDGNRGDIGIREGGFSPSQFNIQIFLP